MVQVTINNKWEVIHRVSTGIFTFDLDPFYTQCNGYASFDNEYLGNGAN